MNLRMMILNLIIDSESLMICWMIEGGEGNCMGNFLI